MPDYRWKGINKQGEAQRGVAFALSPTKLQAYLLEKNIALLSWREKQSCSSLLPKLTLQRPIPQQQIIAFFDHLALLLGSNIPLPQALSLVKHHLASKQLQKIVGKILERVQGGSRFTDALSLHTPPFTQLTIHVVSAGEQAGALAAALKQLAIYLDEKQKLAKKITHAALLPTLTFILALLICLGLFIFVIPQFASLLLTTGRELPTATQAVLAVSTFLQDEYHQINLLSGLFIVVLSIKLLSYHRRVVHIAHKVVLHIPVLKTIVIHTNLLRFLQTLLLLVRASTPLHQALALASKTVTNIVLQAQLATVASRIAQGLSFHEAFQALHSPYIPQSLQAAIAVGEQSEKLDIMLEKSILFFQQTLEGIMQIVLTVFQPLLLLFVGLCIAFIMFAVYLPIFQAAAPTAL